MAAIQITNVEKRYKSLQALGGVSLTIEEGEFFGLLGPNGAGKTTLISIIAGLTRADAGNVTIHGHDVVRDYREARRRLGVVPQELVFDPFFTVRETLRMQSGYYGMQNNDKWIDEVMHHLDLTNKADANMRSLSGGMKRRVLVAQALVHKPPVIVLDEPTAGVDVELRQTLWKGGRARYDVVADQAHLRFAAGGETGQRTAARCAEATGLTSRRTGRRQSVHAARQ
jgi:ABC-2 type transport system ATP-binding protein